MKTTALAKMVLTSMALLCGCVAADFDRLEPSDDCASSAACRLEDRCYLRDGACERTAMTDRACAASPGCRERGACDAIGPGCGARTEAEDICRLLECKYLGIAMAPAEP